jgi:hypothetical protein
MNISKKKAKMLALLLGATAFAAMMGGVQGVSVQRGGRAQQRNALNQANEGSTTTQTPGISSGFTNGGSASTNLENQV